MRLLGRFPGVDFLLAYDERTLVETLQDPARGRVSSARARAFMEKIVQYPLSLPPLLTGKIVKLLNAGLTEIVTPERIESGFESGRFARIILTTMPSQLTTPRAIERFLAQTREQFRIHNLDEMNDVDLILATFLRVQFPDLFAQLQRWKPQLTRGSTALLHIARRDDTAIDWNELLRHVEEDDNREDARAVLQVLFPAVSGNGTGRAEPRRFAHPDYFDRYLAQTIPEGDIPDATVTRALDLAAAGNASELWNLILADDDERVTLALSKIRGRYPDIEEIRGQPGPEGPVTVELLAAGMRLVDQLEDRQVSWTSALSQTTYWAVNVLRLLLDAEPNAHVGEALAACRQVARRAHVVSAAASTLDNVRPETQESLRSTLMREAESLLPVLLDDLRLGDESDLETGHRLLYSLIEEAGLMPALQSGVHEGLQNGEFALEDVAARLVGFSYLVGGPSRPMSASFSGKLFSQLTGVSADSAEHDEAGEWPDTSWPRRKGFAAKYLGGGREAAASSAY